MPQTASQRSALGPPSRQDSIHWPADRFLVGLACAPLPCLTFTEVLPILPTL